MAVASRYDSVAEARAHLKELLDSAAQGAPAQLRREPNGQFAVVDADRLRRYLAALGERAVVAHEHGSWWVYIPGVPVSADGQSLDEAVTEMVVALREYAEDWVNHLSPAPNHANNWGLVQLVYLSTDEQLVDWLNGK